ncbi:circularin A/uberolysin family circular bacteriocin [Gracilibacillus halotolerans]|uniref:Circularin A/uberolysin family circular bacteriocin n=1 Tax=Gracilibacillus halotolerans TaxID=74386 RepID=A0A841RK80_9BACI|nr:circular bacteriocin, circularin A/uberolysin family [Gracilibacillus halotolerans]MBB6512372.1 circularin A/uberolysin family circular bacteriocin [Gracilibacillus halotolerans]
MVKVKYKNNILLSGTLLAISLAALAFVSAPFLAAQLGISTASAMAIINLIDGIRWVTVAMSIIAAASGVGAIGSALTAVVLQMIKKQGKAKAAAF